MFIFSNDGGRKNLNHLREDVIYWHKPVGAILEIAKHVKDSNKNDYNSLEIEYKEVLIGSLFLIILEKTENQKFFISKTKNNPPDFVFMFLKKDEKDRLWISSREVEIVRNVNSINELEGTILSKDINYPKDTTILCNVETPGIIDLESLSMSICSRLRNISDIFILFHGAMIKNINNSIDKKISLVQISPEYITYSCEVDLKEEINNFIKNPEKLIYIKDGNVYYGKRDEEEDYPKLIKTGHNLKTSKDY